LKTESEGRTRAVQCCYTVCTDVDGVTHHAAAELLIHTLCNTPGVVEAMYRHDHDCAYVESCTLCCMMQYRVHVIKHDTLTTVRSRKEHRRTALNPVFKLLLANFELICQVPIPGFEPSSLAGVIDLSALLTRVLYVIHRQIRTSTTPCTPYMCSSVMKTETSCADCSYTSTVSRAFNAVFQLPIVCGDSGRPIESLQDAWRMQFSTTLQNARRFTCPSVVS
jgi:hypothetical protein